MIARITTAIKKRLRAGQARPGSGLPARPAIRALVWLRRVSQAGFLGLFLVLLVATAYRGSTTKQSFDLDHRVEAFLLVDPFVAAMTFLSTKTVYRELWWSLGLVALTVVVGRVFCGWICPFGTLHHCFAWIFPSRYVKGSRRVEQNKTHPLRQSVKYYLLFAFLLAALAGSAIGGMFDPICVAVRAIDLGVLPAAQYVTARGSDEIYERGGQGLQQEADQANALLHQYVFSEKQFYFHQTWLIVSLLVAVLFLNRFVPRFWCRVLCPLGAFLGVLSRFALFGMEKDHKKCTDCNLCLWPGEGPRGSSEKPHSGTRGDGGDGRESFGRDGHPARVSGAVRRGVRGAYGLVHQPAERHQSHCGP